MSNPFCSWIEELARRGVVSGCGGENYCPNASVTREQMAELHAKCFRRYYFRWQYLRENAHLLWPGLQHLGIGRQPVTPGTYPAHPGVPKPKSGLEILRRKGLRQDGPHRPSTVSEPADSRREAE